MEYINLVKIILLENVADYTDRDSLTIKQELMI